MDKNLKNQLIIVGFGVTLFVALFRLADIMQILGSFVIGVKPVLAGSMIAFVLNVPMVRVERVLNRFLKRSKKHPGELVIQSASLLITVILLFAIVTLLGMLIIPPLLSSVSSVVSMFQSHITTWEKQLEQLGIDGEWVSQIFFNLRSYIQDSALGGGVNGILNASVEWITGTIGSVFSNVIAFIIAIYLLLGKKEIHRNIRALAYSILPEKTVHVSGDLWNLLCKTYADFFSGQCVEAVILGVLMFAAFTISGLPYAGLIAVLTAVSSFIPYVGSFLSCGIGVILIFMVDPVQAVIALVVYQIVQFCENQFIYPRVVGGAVGLPALWTLVAVLVGGNIGGIIGMIFCIPLTSVVFVLLKRFVRRQLQKKEIKI